MATFVVRRLIASLFIFLAATYLMYILTALSGDPLEDLRTSAAPNKEQLIAARTRLLDLDVPVYLRYFLWIGGILGLRGKGFFDLGVTVQNQPVNVLLGQAAGSTLQLVTIATLLAIIIRRDASLNLRGRQGALEFDLPLTREAMADYLGLTLETVSRQVSALKRDGVIVLSGKRHIVIPDLDRLMEETGDDSDGGLPV